MTESYLDTLFYDVNSGSDITSKVQYALNNNFTSILKGTKIGVISKDKAKIIDGKVIKDDDKKNILLSPILRETEEVLNVGVHPGKPSLTIEQIMEAENKKRQAIEAKKIITAAKSKETRKDIELNAIKKAFKNFIEMSVTDTTNSHIHRTHDTKACSIMVIELNENLFTKICEKYNIKSINKKIVNLNDEVPINNHINEVSKTLATMYFEDGVFYE